MAEARRNVRVRKLYEQGEDADFEKTTPSERISMMWQLALDAWAFKGEDFAQSRLPRHTVCLLRSEARDEESGRWSSHRRLRTQRRYDLLSVSVERLFHRVVHEIDVKLVRAEVL